MSAIKRIGETSSGMMEPHVDSSGEATYYVKKEITATTYGCTGCGLVWDRKRYAEECESRGHSTFFTQYYGGYFENGKHVGGTEYRRQSLECRKDIIS